MSVSSGSDGLIVGNVTGGNDWLCYTINVGRPGEYKISANTSSDSKVPYYFEVDGNAVGSMLKTRGNSLPARFRVREDDSIGNRFLRL